MSESDERRPDFIAHRFAKTASSQHWIGHRFLLRLTRHRDFLSMARRLFYADSIWIYQSWQGSSQVLLALLFGLLEVRACALAGSILGASKPNVVVAMIWIGVHAPARF
jgi:hypothetical protein